MMYIASQVTISIPGLHVPLTLQTLFCILLPLVFRKWQAALGITLFLILGAVGLPVFAGHAGGIDHFAGNSGGYLIGFLISALLVWKTQADSIIKRLLLIFLEFTILQFIVLVCGATWILISSGVWFDFVSPFIIPLLVKAAIGTLIFEVLGLFNILSWVKQHS